MPNAITSAERSVDFEELLLDPRFAHLSAADIAQRVHDRYAHLPFYCDRGEVATAYFDVDGNLTSVNKLYFRTAFRRPDKFRFAFTVTNQGSEPSPPNWHIIHHDRGTTSVWDGIDQRLKTGGTFASAIAAATGISSSAAIRIPELLLPDHVRPGAALDQVGLLRERLERFHDQAVTIPREMIRVPAPKKILFLPPAEDNHASLLKLTLLSYPMERSTTLSAVEIEYGVLPERLVKLPEVVTIDAETMLISTVTSECRFASFSYQSITNIVADVTNPPDDDALAFNPPGQ